MLEGLRSWARRHTEEGRYSPVGIAFHWIMAVLVLFQLAWGFWSDVAMPGGDKILAYKVHSAVGLPILILATLRGFWRILIPGPENDADRLGIQTKIARVTHVLFYVCFFGLPLSGWAMWSSIATPGPLYVAGVLPWPQLPLSEWGDNDRFAVLQAAEMVHRYLVILLLVLIPVHVGAALKHHFWDRHDVLRGMLPEISDHAGEQVGQQNKPRAPRFPKASELG